MGGDRRCTGSVGHEEDVLALVLVGQIGVLLAQVSERLLDQVVFVLAADHLAARARESRLHVGPPSRRCSSTKLRHLPGCQTSWSSPRARTPSNSQSVKLVQLNMCG